MKTQEPKNKSFAPAWICLGLVIAAFAVWSLLPVVNRRDRSPAPRSLSMNNARQIALAIHNYTEANGHFPPPYSTDEDGNALHSWRVLILPYMEQHSLYELIDLTKPWNDPANVKYHDEVPPGYRDPKDESPFADQTTTYVAIVGDETVWRPGKQTKLEDLTDGTSNTLLLIQSDQFRVHWMSPFDPRFEEIIAMGPRHRTNLLTGPHTGGVVSAAVDGSGHFLDEETTAERFRALATIAGGETVDILD